MLHSTLPRAFLAPGLNYFAGYYGDQLHHPYGPTSYMSIGAEEYTRIATDQHVLPWENSRSSTPCPLDLSLKPIPKIEECIEVDDEEDRLQRHQRGRYPILVDDDEELVVDDTYDQKKDLSSPTPIRTPMVLMDQKYHQKILTPLQTYQQQLLLTPQHHPSTPNTPIHSPMTPPSTPSPPQCPRRRHRDTDEDDPTTPRSSNNPDKHVSLPRKKKHARRLKFDEDTSSPVSGTVILGPDEAVVTGDIDPAFNIVEVTDEARAELAKIENRLGPYQCKLCRQLHDDAFQLAQHRCSRIAHVEYRCPECDKRFSCPANLASHRRWHKPRASNGTSSTSATAATATDGTSSVSSGVEVTCTRCDAKFTRQAALRKHLATQHPELVQNSNGQSNNNNNNNSNMTNNNNNENGLEMKNIGTVQIGSSPINIEMP
ncbi:insulinoma-associated protein 1a-like [Leptopilina heterotoma]|uniref:insulinoma-associated protein 1a-like n=1 Tax=Leptopilina heterotoma TaxID=63436 RepID=UPI001CA95656|nr:insulinoma-associated protein 1a-like [Leptopilina heterotoma]